MPEDDPRINDDPAEVRADGETADNTGHTSGEGTETKNAQTDASENKTDSSGLSELPATGTDIAPRVFTADAFETLPELEENSIHAVVTDPPYNFDGGFMSAEWDDIGTSREYQEWCRAWAEEVRRVLMPGGHLVAFCSTKMHHRLFSGVEDAGFEIRDTLVWLRGGGFPKSTDISKRIDRHLGEYENREVVGKDVETSGYGHIQSENAKHGHRPEDYYEDKDTQVIERTAPATPAAEQFNGFGTQLKPAVEPIVLARNPLGEGTVTENILEWGTGALNIDDCRIPPKGDGRPARRVTTQGGAESRTYGDNFDTASGVAEGTTNKGRHPANVLLDDTAAKHLDARNEQTRSCRSTVAHDGYGGDDGGDRTQDANGENDNGESMFVAGVSTPGNQYDEVGGPSRFFYDSKATEAERTLDGRINNPHIAVKPLNVMEWLVQLVTAEGQVVLDPFAGTGTTLRAARELKRAFVGVELDPEYADVARVRAGLSASEPSHVRTNDQQLGLEDF